MSIDQRCREQRNIADSMFMDFKYTKPGSAEQVRALNTLNFLLSMWNDFLGAEVRRMDAALSICPSKA
jgi:hypothetical protein